MRFWIRSVIVAAVLLFIGSAAVQALGATENSIVIDGGRSYSNSREVTLSVSTVGALSEMQISEDPTFSDATWVPLAAETPWTLSNSDGDKIVLARFRDPEGAISESVSDSIILDRLPPTSAIAPLSETQPTPTFTVSWSGTDATSGIARFYVQVRNHGLTAPGDPGTPSPWFDLSSAPLSNALTFTGEEAHRYCFRVSARDSAGNLEDWPADADTCTRVADTTAPSNLQVSINGGSGATNSTAATLTLSASDLVGVTEMRLSEDSGFGASPWVPYATSASFSLSEPDGTKTVYAQFRDADGNISSLASDTILLDRVAPSGTLTLNLGALSTTSKNVTATFNASDDRSGIAQFRLSNEGSSWPAFSAGSGNQSIPFSLSSGDGTKIVNAQFVDAAGNVSTALVSDAIDGDSGLFDTDYGVTINAGAEFTNDRNVLLDLYGPAGTSEMRISNDGGFVGSLWEPFATHRAWTLGEHNGQVVTKNVFVRFRSSPTGGATQVNDSIVVDPRPPTSSAPSGSPLAAAQGTINTSASDQAGGAGVTSMQLSTNPTFPDAVWRPYAPSVNWYYDTRARTTVYFRFGDATGNVSAVYSAVLANPASPTVVTAVSPGPGTGIQSRRPIFRWLTLAGASSYQVQVSTASTFATTIVDATTSANVYQPASPLPRANLVWRVRSAGGIWSPAWGFTTPVADPPAPTSPAVGAQILLRSPTLTWSAVSGASTYQAQLASDAFFTSPIRTVGTSQTNTRLLPLAGNARHWWRVRAVVSGVWTPWSAGRMFTTPALDQVALRSPAHGASITLPRLFDWTDVSGAVNYRFQLCTTSACTAAARDVTVINSSYSLTGSLAPGTYYWRARAQGPSSAIGPWSALRSLVR